MEEQNWSTLQDIVNQQVFNVRLKFYNDIEVVESYAQMLENRGVDQEEILVLLQNMAMNDNFDHFMIAAQDGKAMMDHDVVIDLSDKTYLTTAFDEGKTMITEPNPSSIRDVNIIEIVTPIYKEREPYALLIGTYNALYLNQLFLPFFNDVGNIVISDHSGNIIAHNHHYESLNYDFETLNKEFKQQDTLQIEDGDYYIYGADVGINDWRMFVSIPKDVVLQRLNEIVFASLMVSLFVLCFIVVFYYRHIYMQRQYSKHIEHVAYYDELTGLPNLNKFKLNAQRVLKNRQEACFVSTKIDVLEFKMINELYGFEMGDQLLCELSNVLKSIPGILGIKVGTIGRIAKDEFILLHKVESSVEKKLQMGRILEYHINEKMKPYLENHVIELRVGRHFIGKEEFNIDEIIEKVNLVHHKMKAQKKIKLLDYDEMYKDDIRKETTIKNKMKQALEKKEFKLYLQPKYHLASSSIGGCEALVRWVEQDGTMVMPNVFIPLFEETGFIEKLDFYMFESVCQEIQYWMEHKLPIVRVSVNFSKLHVSNPLFIDTLCAITDRYGIPRTYLEIEVTESALIDQEASLITWMHQMKDAGFYVSMDDFGSGYSSLGILANLPLDVVKIDQSFFRKCDDKVKIKAIVKSILLLTKELHIQCVAEGVEDEEDLHFLKAQGCDYIQSYYYSKPIKAKDFHQLDFPFTSID